MILLTLLGGKYTHSSTDTPDKVDPQVLVEACMLVSNVIRSLDKDYEILCKNQELLCEK